ncbi:hypothetical protein Spb1_36490 [Planctopirus ephydatiae]|uniref:Uncharacterized protein n=1 Tax=Planctopirus ephydatiae TaxID=2528019 RepID=A0A518GSZ2_9PLAN|nr:hypothetical protein [Planctopirus ephydatiae]QDV31704.1 hypothetical protein Spb1_36490 [Planctopirus ephydatiae]
MGNYNRNDSYFEVPVVRTSYFGKTVTAGQKWLFAAAVMSAGLVAEMGEALAQARTIPASISREERDRLMNDLSAPMMEFDQYNNSRLRPPANSDLSNPTTELERVRPLVRDAQDELSDLILDLGDESARRPALRSLLVDAMNLQARLTSIVQQAQRTNDHRYLTEDFRELDAQWRELSYRMSLATDLSKRTQQRAANLDGISQSIGKVLLIQPQVNSRALMEKFIQMSTDMRNLTDDVAYEVNDRRIRDELTLALNRVNQQVRTMSLAVQDQADRNIVVDQYKRFQELWYPEAAKLQAYTGSAMDRDLRRIAQTDSEIRQLLMMPQQLDKQQLVYLTNSLKKDIDEFFQRTPLLLLVHLPKSNTVLATADEFYGVCEYFVDIVNRSNTASMTDVVEAFRYIEAAERNFAATFRPIQSESAQSILRKIEQTIGTLRSTLMVQRDDLSRQAAIDLAAEIDGLTYNLQLVSQRWLQTERPVYAAEAQREIAAFSERAMRLHDSLVRGSTAAQARQQTEQLYESWRRVYSYLVQCRTEDRTQLGRLASRMTPALVELRTMLSQ